MHWINFHIKHTAASQCSIIHLAVWTMRKDLHIIFSTLHVEMQSCADTEWKMGVASFLLRVCGYHGKGGTA